MALVNKTIVLQNRLNSTQIRQIAQLGEKRASFHLAFISMQEPSQCLLSFRAGSAKGVMSNMAKAYARNSNFLLNVGPDKNGKIIESSIRTLAEVGKLLKPNATPGLPK